MNSHNNYTIRFGYCPPSPGPHKSTGCMWFNNIEEAIEAYYNFRLDRKVPIYIKYNNGPYKQIDYDWLLEHSNISS